MPSPRPGQSTHFDQYVRFVTAINTGDYLTALGCIDTKHFVAVIPDQGHLSFTQFMDHMDRLRGLIPDFGNNVAVLEVVEQGDLISVLYRSRFTASAAPTRPVEYTATDWVTFDTRARITQLRVLFDRADTQTQLFGRPMPPI